MVGEPQSEGASTPRGDRDARRREVLQAAADVLEEQRWQDFSIREVAARVGVSPGAVYLWFNGKDDIIAHLQAARLRSEAAAVRMMPNGLSPMVVVTRITAMLTRMYTEVGRHAVAIVDDADREFAGGASELRNALEFAIDVIHSRLQTVLGAGDDEVPDLAARLAWMWASARGIADDLVGRRYEVHGVEPEDFFRVATERTAAGLLGPDLLPS